MRLDAEETFLRLVNLGTSWRESWLSMSPIFSQPRLTSSGERSQSPERGVAAVEKVLLVGLVYYYYG